MTLTNNLPVEDGRLIGPEYLGNFGSLPVFGNVITFASLLILENGTAEDSDCINVTNVPMVVLEGA
jgi:hypothetical protein